MMKGYENLHFSVEGIKALEADIKQVLKTVEKKHAVTLTYESPNGFYPYQTKASLTIEKLMPFEADYRRVAEKYGLKPEWIGKVLWTQKSAYRILGFDLTQNTVVLVRLNKGKLGGQYFVSPEEVIKHMQNSENVALLAVAGDRATGK